MFSVVREGGILIKSVVDMRYIIEWTDSTREFLDWLMRPSIRADFPFEADEWEKKEFYEYRPLLLRKKKTPSPTTVYYLGYKTRHASPERQDDTSKVA